MAADFSGVGEHAASLALKMGSAAVDAISFMTGLGEELPIVKPVLMKLMAVREKVETVRNNREELAELHERCTYMTACLIVKYRQNLSVDMDVAAVEDCVEATLKFIERCNRRGKVSRVLSASSDKDVIAALKTRVDNLTGDLGLAGIAVLEKAYNMATTLVSIPLGVRFSYRSPSP